MLKTKSDILLLNAQQLVQKQDELKAKTDEINSRVTNAELKIAMIESE